MKITQLILGTFFFMNGLLAQTPSLKPTQEQFHIQIKKTKAPIKIDGELSEADWATAAVATDFWVRYPQNGTKPRYQTEARVAYDDQYIYAAFVCRDSGDYVIQTLKRDIDYWNSDGVGILLDPTARQNNGFLFGVSPEGVQSEALIGGGDGPQHEWDNKWYAEVKKTTTGWTAEMAIPFKSIRYEAGRTTWYVNFIRNYPKAGQWHTWTNIPPQFNGISLGHTGTLDWDAAPSVAKSNIALIPYTSGSVSKDYKNKKNTAQGTPLGVEGSINGGFDAKIALTPSLNLDATFNPDFSQIEVDVQQTNLTRFNIFFPERRTFFLENSEVLTNFGIPPIRPFFSRTIGLDANAQTVPILYGARLSGNLTNSVRVNAFNMHTLSNGGSKAGQNFSAAAVQRNFWGRSYIKAGFLSRQGFEGTQVKHRDYGRNAILSMSLRSKDNRVETWLEGQRSFKHGISTANNMFVAGFNIALTNWEILHDWTSVGSNYYADMGFINRIENYDAARDTVIRLGFTQNFTEINYRTRPKTGAVAEHWAGLENFILWNPNGSLNEWFDRLRYFLTFKNTTELRFRMDYNYNYLPFPFRFSAENALLNVGKYNYANASIEYVFDKRNRLTGRIRATTGQFYNGTRNSLLASATYRAQPWGNFTMNVDWNRISLPPLENSTADGITTLLLISPKVEFNFNRNLFWTTFFQYNTQANNVNINSRLQWRYKPLSDLFVVYTDNYFATEEWDGLNRWRPFQVKNRALVLKLNYWLNL
jgi:hypothetical protein